MSADEHRPSAAERHHELAMAAISRAPAPPEHTVGLTLNAKGDVQIEVTGRGHDLDALTEHVSTTFEWLRAKYPRSEPTDADEALKQARKVASIQANRAKQGGA